MALIDMVNPWFDTEQVERFYTTETENDFLLNAFVFISDV